VKLAAYQRDMALLRPLGIYVKNVGRVVVTDPRIVLQIPKRPGLRVVDELPQKPRLGYPSISGSIGLDGLVVNELSDIWEVHVRVRKIQASAEAWMPTFWLGADQELEVPILAKVYADNLPSALEVPTPAIGSKPPASPKP